MPISMLFAAGAQIAYAAELDASIRALGRYERQELAGVVRHEIDELVEWDVDPKRPGNALAACAVVNEQLEHAKLVIADDADDQVALDPIAARHAREQDQDARRASIGTSDFHHVFEQGERALPRPRFGEGCRGSERFPNVLVRDVGAECDRLESEHGSW